MAAPMTGPQANAVYDILVEHTGADEDWMRDDFVHHQTADSTDEYRFQGALGFGGKFWNCNDRWYVTCYPEDLTSDRQRAIDETNTALAELKERM